jgi:hypothetical protein
VNKSVKRMSMAALGAVLVVAVAMIAQLMAQQQSKITGDFRNAQTAEVRDAQGTVLLRGTFAPADGDDDQEVERLATLQPTEAGATMAGEAEVEYQKDAPDTQEVEFQVLSAQPGAVLTLVVDGKAVLTATADGKGRAEAEAMVAVKQP